jgi:hypothetical protein
MSATMYYNGGEHYITKEEAFRRLQEEKKLAAEKERLRKHKVSCDKARAKRKAKKK